MVPKMRCISPVDGRYSPDAEVLADYFSEHALQRYRTIVEVEYLKALSRERVIRDFSEEEILFLGRLKGLPLCDAEVIKAIETCGYDLQGGTKHDVKAVEYFLRDRFKGTSLEDVTGFIHFALTSEDVNNVAYALMMKNSLDNVVVPKLESIVDSLSDFAKGNAHVPLLARTHGQPASPTSFGKEFAVFKSRLESQLFDLKRQGINAKLNGATGNFNAHVASYPQVDWLGFSERFIMSLNYGGIRIRNNPLTTQIEPHDSYCAVFDNMRRMNSVLLDFSQDVWRYISDGWLKLRSKGSEVGSSTMPHKVNPIDFENAEGNLGLANALFTFFSQKLPISRLQRDLSDSTVLRNVGVAFAHSLIAYNSIGRGLGKIAVNESKVIADLNSHPEVLAEAMQVILKTYGVNNAYELLKEHTRGKEVTLESLHGFIDGLAIGDSAKLLLKSLKISDYTGLAKGLSFF